MTKTTQLFHAFALVAAIHSFQILTFAQNYTFKTVTPPNSVETQPTAINSMSDAVGQYRTSDGRIHGFLMKDDIYTTLDFPGAYNTGAAGINDAGKIVGYYTYEDQVPHGFIYENGVFIALNHPLGTKNSLQGINNSGVIVGFYGETNSSYYRGFSYANGTFTPIDYPGALESAAFGINDSGEIVGYLADGVNSWGYRLKNGVYSVVEPPGGFGSYAAGINSAGTVVGWSNVNGNVVGYTFTDVGGYALISYPGSNRSFVTGVSNEGELVGFFGDSATTGFIASPVTERFICLLYDPQDPARNNENFVFKIQLCNASGINQSAAGLVLKALKIVQPATNEVFPVEEAGAQPDQKFKYNPNLGGTGGYTLRIKTENLPNGNYFLRFKVVGEEGAYKVRFKVR